MLTWLAKWLNSGSSQARRKALDHFRLRLRQFLWEIMEIGAKENKY